MKAAPAGRPAPSEYASYYEKYVSRVPEEDLAGALEADRAATLSLLRSIPEARAGHRYEPGKWSIREVFRHVVDTERVFGFRAFWFARNVGTPLPGFEQDDVMRSAPAATALADLAAEFDLVRRGHQRFFESLDPDAWSRSGIASGNPVSVRALAAIITGHSRHHTAVLEERYL
ncbi:MAG TPA: DinB family protein [Thermoanaerobaculia bacterium]|nr:DinB family protein [Thermoanaerobaculia bacterium]